MVGEFDGKAMDSRYLGYFACFNRQEFYLAHEVLEDLWLESRGAPEANFFKALIQLTGAFVHLQKNRLRPAAALFRLARGYFSDFPKDYHQLDLAAVIKIADLWLELLERGQYSVNPLASQSTPQLFPSGLSDIRIASCEASR